MNYRLSILTATLLLSLFPAQGIQAQRGQPQGIAPTDFLDILRNRVSRQDNHEISVLFPQKPGFWSGVLAQATEEQKTEAESLFEQGIQYDSSGKYPEAIDSFQRALALFEAIGDQDGMSRAWNSLGIISWRLGEYENAIDYYQRSLAIIEEMGDRTGVAFSLNNLGAVYNSLGQYEEAQDYYQRALTVAEETNTQILIAVSLNNLGAIYQSLGEYGKVIDHFQRSLGILEELGDQARVAQALNNLGTIYDSLGQYEEAIDYYQRSLALKEELGARAGIANSLNNLGIIYEQLGQYEDAINYYQRSLRITEEIGDRVGTSYSLSNLGIVYRQLGEYEKAIDHYQQALALAEEIDDQTIVALALNNLGVVYSYLGEYEQSIDHCQRALAIAEEMGDRPGVTFALNNLGLAYKNLQRYSEAQKVLYQAIEIKESLRENLTDAQKVDLFDTQSASYRLLQETLIAQNKIEEALEISERGRARAFVELLAQKSDLEVQPLKIADIQKVAQEQQATLVEYSLVSGNQQLYIWIFSPEGKVNFTSIDLSTLDTPLDELVTMSRQAIGVRGRGLTVVAEADFDPEENLQRLHQLLIEPIADYLPDNREEKVIFMPQGSLFLVPFPALKDIDGNYLLDKHTILTAPAIQVLQLTHQQRPTGKEVLIVGNPTMPTVGIPPQQLSPLPGAETEAKQVAELLGVQPLIGSQATKAAVLSQLSNAGIIHLATHGLLDDFGYDTPGAVALAPTEEDNGLLTAGEIINLKLNADLVILSACNTGRGDLTGDGVVGLSRSLLTAGASSVIVSLWEVPDEPTAFLMTEFYRLREEGLNKAQALRQAMFKTRGKYPEPVNWAAFTLNGES